ncbi:MAG: RluA family pseudouridine synthase [Spirochaetaceae bacterium]|jgi:23S rRNA pseudouridine955/2504/2580 synthase|nr:RluA family pseudouridine synthase [Spirochaetaceae bacterium]
MNIVRLKAGSNDDGRRIDRILRRACAELPVSAIHRLLRKGRVLLDGKRAERGSRVSNGQFIEILGADIQEAVGRADHALQPETPGVSGKSKIVVLYEGGGILAVSKAAGMRTQEELSAIVREYLHGKTEPSLSFTPGPLHRLDRWASGVIVFGSSLAGAQRFSALMQSSLLQKTYIALLEGSLQNEQIWRDNLCYSNAARKTRLAGQDSAEYKTEDAKAKYAETHVVPLELCGAFTLAKIEIKTGRTHQIRAQAAAHGFPLYGDRKYGGKNRPPFFLHAFRLVFPNDSHFPLSISAPFPPAFAKKLSELGFHAHNLQGSELCQL